MRQARRALMGWLLLGLLGVYTVVIFYGVGAPVAGTPWYAPRQFLAAIPGLGLLLESAGRALVAFGAPALVLALAVLYAARSALARALAISCLTACLLFTYYGIAAPDVWTFFGWRGSVVLIVLALCVGFSVGTPFLAGSWLRLSWPLRIAVWLPPALLVVAFVRNATGTDPALKYSISPWPVVPVFGIEVGSVLVVCWLTGAALGLTALARAGGRSGAAHALRVGGVLAGMATSALLLIGIGWLGLLPFSVDERTLWPAAVISALTIAAAGAIDVRSPAVLGRRALHLAVGAVLLGVPLVAGQGLARWDYHVTRDYEARSLIDALDAYYQREQLYPDELTQLVETGQIERIPEPSIGFSFLYDGEFRYQSFGTSFLLEFPAPRWVECAYTPPFEDEDFDDENWEDEDGEDEEDPDVAAEPDEAGGDDASLDESWSCPSRPPELW